MSATACTENADASTPMTTDGQPESTYLRMCFVTGNVNKKKELERIMSSAGDCKIDLTSHAADIPELQGEGEYVATEKCKWAHKSLLKEGKIKEGDWVLTEDTSLEFTALKGLPGVFIKWFLDKLGVEDLPKLVEGFEDKGAEAKTILAVWRGQKDTEPRLYIGSTAGKIVAPRGPLAFGWDPNFEPIEGEGKTYAEMTGEAKDKISHRGRAFSKFKTAVSNGELDSNVGNGEIDAAKGEAASTPANSAKRGRSDSLSKEDSAVKKSRKD